MEQSKEIIEEVRLFLKQNSIVPSIKRTALIVRYPQIYTAYRKQCIANGTVYMRNVEFMCAAVTLGFAYLTDDPPHTYLAVDEIALKKCKLNLTSMSIEKSSQFVNIGLPVIELEPEVTKQKIQKAKDVGKNITRHRCVVENRDSEYYLTADTDEGEFIAIVPKRWDHAKANAYFIANCYNIQKKYDINLIENTVGLLAQLNDEYEFSRKDSRLVNDLLDRIRK